MDELEVRIIQLDPMRVASAYGFGPSPEAIAHSKINAFVKSKGLVTAGGAAYRSFGFNNPNLSSGSPNYGYEIWITVASEVEAEGDIRIVDFMGGLYAVARCENLSVIGERWQQLVKWAQNSPYKMAHHQWLEELLNPLEIQQDKFYFDLYLPIYGTRTNADLR